MICVDDPTTVTITLSVKDAATLRELTQRATSAAVGVVFTPEQKLLWEQFCSQVERAEHLQRSIWAQLYAGPGAAVPEPAPKKAPQKPWWRR